MFVLYSINFRENCGVSIRAVIIRRLFVASSRKSNLFTRATLQSRCKRDANAYRYNRA